jgi:exoribonuclease II
MSAKQVSISKADASKMISEELVTVRSFPNDFSKAFSELMQDLQRMSQVDACALTIEKTNRIIEDVEFFKVRLESIKKTLKVRAMTRLREI